MFGMNSSKNRNFVKRRRDFLNGCLILGSSTITHAPNTTVIDFLSNNENEPIKATGTSGLVQLKYRFSGVEDADVRSRFWSMLAAHAINPWLRSWMKNSCASIPCDFEALVELRSNARRQKFGTLLDIWELSDMPEGDARTFEEWFREFHPVTRDDFLMLVPLYRHYRYSGQTINSVQTTPDLWLDSMLRCTRGMLFWRHQWTELIRMVGGMTAQSATRLVGDYVLKRPCAARSLQQKFYTETGQSLIQIIEERSPGRMPIGNPDFITGEWLYNHMRC